MSTYEDILDHRFSWWDSEREAEIDEHLTFIDDVDLSEPDYSFDLLRIWVRKHDGMILWATDSGCSCPSPFEDVAVRDLKEATLSTPVDTFLRLSGWSADGYSSVPEAELRKAISEVLRKAKTAGAR